MSLIYSSNSPQFLEYIASCKTREDLINDPALCILLNDPHIKDNMELAFLAREADYGDRAKKSEFIGFFLANGPELDTDTIMFYRNKILMSYAYSSIAKEEYGDMRVVDKLRVEKYGKEIDTGDAEEDEEKKGSSNNCFKNPCDYLQPLNAALGMIGDSENFKTIGNIFARKNRESQEEKDKNKNTGKDNKNNKDNKDNKDNKNTEESSGTSDSVWGNIRKHVSSRIIPSFQSGYRVMMKTLGNQMTSLTEKNRKAGIQNEVTSVGDSNAEEIAETISGTVKTNIFANMGDCARMWEHIRRLNPYDPTQNTKGPADVMSVKSNRMAEGTPRNMPGSRTENNERQAPATTTAAGANASAKPLRMRETVHAYLRTEAQRITEWFKSDNTWDGRITAMAMSRSTSVWDAWQICAEEHGWNDAEWKAAREQDRYAKVSQEGVEQKNMYLDMDSSYWQSYTNAEEYKRIAAEYLALFNTELPHIPPPDYVEPTETPAQPEDPELQLEDAPIERPTQDAPIERPTPDAPIERPTPSQPPAGQQ